MRILGIESSCDETAAAVVEDGTRILSNVVASQVDIHARYGGIVPEVASRQHLLTVLPVVRQALEQAKTDLGAIDGVATTHGPGLAGSLLVGMNAAKAIAYARRLPLIGVNHLEGHIYANWLDKTPDQQPQFPLICLIASGGHTDLVLMEGHGRYHLLGRTRDDAAGEAFDKVARALGLGFPGGPAIERIARSARRGTPFTRPWLRDTDDFSFSGLKTAVLRAAAEQDLLREGDGQSTPGPQVGELAAGFQDAVAEVLATKTADAARRLGVRQVVLAGGVAANTLLRQRMAALSPVPVSFPSPKHCTDNAAMIASCGCFKLHAGVTAAWDMDAIPNLPVTSWV
ncbi:MAG: tRNA (adenosine(37)-N6)-threonylcarbamoyltransferase complex transferase subunit TsaD [Chloroflexi bacterium]|nr:tRNA (adenosine(37)-N6)-threonylcarbamoyltransferase complex transferase subunit TsaD [Chloroflexota bacterium]